MKLIIDVRVASGMKNSTFKIEFPGLALVEDRKRTKTILFVSPRAKATKRCQHCEQASFRFRNI